MKASQRNQIDKESDVAHPNQFPHPSSLRFLPHSASSASSIRFSGRQSWAIPRSRPSELHQDLWAFSASAFCSMTVFWEASCFHHLQLLQHAKILIRYTLKIRVRRRTWCLRSAHWILSVLPLSCNPSFSIVSIAIFASSLIANDTYPTPFDTLLLKTTKADRTGARSEKRVWRSVDVAAYGRFETKNVALL